MKTLVKVSVEVKNGKGSISSEFAEVVGVTEKVLTVNKLRAGKHGEAPSVRPGHFARAQIGHVYMPEEHRGYIYYVTKKPEENITPGDAEYKAAVAAVAGAMAAEAEKLMSGIEDAAGEKIFGERETGRGITFDCASMPIMPREPCRVSGAYINKVWSQAQFTYTQIGDRTLTVMCELPSGFILTESSAAVTEEEFDAEKCKHICMRKLRDRLWELEGYAAAKENYSSKG